MERGTIDEKAIATANALGGSACEVEIERILTKLRYMIEQAETAGLLKPSLRSVSLL